MVQIDATLTPVEGPQFPINIAQGFDRLIEAPGDLTGCIVFTTNAQTLLPLGGTITNLLAYDLIFSRGIAHQGMKIQPAIDYAEPGQTIEIQPEHSTSFHWLSRTTLFFSEAMKASMPTVPRSEPRRH